jgi:putative phage-type endonuclease
MKRVNLVQGSPEWHVWRNGGIGSSDIAKIMGISPFGSALEFYNEKAGIVVNDKSSFATERGKKYEPIARDKFNKLKGANYQPDCFEHPEYPYMLASVDGYDEKTHRLLEIKVPGKKDLELAARGEIPEYYNIQMQWQMAIVDVSMMSYICYDPKSDQIYITTVMRDEKIIAEMYRAACVFWDNFLQGIPPKKQDDDIDFITDDQFVTIALAARKIKGEIVKWELEWDTVKQHILKFGNGRSFTGYGVTATKTSGRKTYDIEAMVADGINVEKYAKVGKESYTIKIDKNENNFD